MAQESGLQKALPGAQAIPGAGRCVCRSLFWMECQYLNNWCETFDNTSIAPNTNTEKSRKNKLFKMKRIYNTKFITSNKNVPVSSTNEFPHENELFGTINHGCKWKNLLCIHDSWLLKYEPELKPEG